MILTKQQRIEYLCEQEIPDYAILKPGRELSLAALALGTNPRRIDADDKARVMAAADALRADLSVKPDAEISAMFDDARLKEWRGQHLLLGDAAKLIAGKIWPDDHYEWEAVERDKCEQEYQRHLKSCLLMGAVPFINPHTRKAFDAAKLSAEHFPHDGLLRMYDLHLCLLMADVDKGYLPVPPKPVSKAPPPITPLTLTSSRSYSRREMEPAADEQLPPTSPALALNLAVWEAKDLWSEGQFAILLCGAEPESRKTRLSNRAIGNAVRAIELAVAVEALTVAHHEQVPRDWDTFSAPATVRYFRPADAITWANGRRAEFPYFPQFVARNDSPSAAALPAGVLEDIRPVAPVAADVKQGGGGPQKHWVDKKAIIKAFGCREDLFESASKFPWLVEARIKGRAGRNSIAPMYDPVAFATNLPGMTYAGDLTTERAWQILKRSFPLSYEDVSQFDPNEPK